MNSEYKGHMIYIPMTGGKAGKGCNVTGSVQVRRSNMILKNVRFKMDKPGAMAQAIEKAKAFVDSSPAAPEQENG